MCKERIVMKCGIYKYRALYCGIVIITYENNETLKLLNIDNVLIIKLYKNELYYEIVI